MRSTLAAFGPTPQSFPPLMMLVITPYPGTRPAALSAAVGVQLPRMTSWHDGLGDCAVIQNQMAVLKEITGSVDTRSGLLTRSTCSASPAIW
uniref:CHI8 n=1 Tax=Arundo donax TaxID=35708 RepID=A0A0A9A0C7_ARUDO